MFEKLENNKRCIDYVLPLIQYDSSKISDLRVKMYSDKAWIRSENDSLSSIKANSIL